MLDRLLAYAESHNLGAEPGFATKTVRWAVICGADGAFRGVVELGDTEAQKNPGLRIPRCPDLSQPELKRGGAGTRHFLVDTAEVVTLLGQDEPDEKLAAKHEFFVGLLASASEAMPGLATSATCLRNDESLAEARRQLEEAGARVNDKVTVALEGHEPMLAVRSDAWHQWWREFRATLAPAQKGSPKALKLVRCLASGELVEAARTQEKITGLTDVGGHPAGDVLAGFKQEAFRSYGLIQAENAPVSSENVATYRAALNLLIRDSSERLGGSRVVHWYKRPVTRMDDPLAFLVALEPEEVAEADAAERARKLLSAIRDGTRPELVDNWYHALTLSGAAGRVMVRDWMEGPFEELAASVAAWFRDLEIVRSDGLGMARPPKFLGILGSLVRDLKDVPAALEARLWRIAVRNEPLPYEVVTRSLARVRSEIVTDEPLRLARLGLLKAYHVRQGDEAMKSGLNENHPSDAYQVGRLMALLAEVQRKALGDVGAGVVQRYYAAASATPALVLGRLVRGAQHHLHKVGSNNPGLAHWFEDQIASVFCRMDASSLPATLSLEEQSLFALGYYQQLAHRNQKDEQPKTAEETTDA